MRAALRVACLVGWGAAVAASPARAVEIRGDGIPASLTGHPGDPARGRALVLDRAKSLCLLCHAAPLPESRFQGNLSPDLAGSGARWSEAQLRLRIVDARLLNPDTLMPPYGTVSGLARVGAAFAGRPILAPAEIEDIVAYLASLKE